MQGSFNLKALLGNKVNIPQLINLDICYFFHFITAYIDTHLITTINNY